VFDLLFTYKDVLETEYNIVLEVCPLIGAKLYQVGTRTSFVDIFSMTLDNKRYVYSRLQARQKWPNAYIYVEEMAQTTLYPLGTVINEKNEVIPLAVYGISSPIPYLERYFGKEWRKPIRFGLHSFSAYMETYFLPVYIHGTSLLWFLYTVIQ